MMLVVRILLICVPCLLLKKAQAQSFEKCEKLLSEVLIDFNKAFEEGAPALLKEPRYQKKIRKLRNIYNAYHTGMYAPEDSIARVNNDAILLALSGQHYRAIQHIGAVGGTQRSSLTEYHKGLFYLLLGEFVNAADVLLDAGQGNSALNAVVALGNLPDTTSLLSRSPGPPPGEDVHGKRSYNNAILVQRAGNHRAAVEGFSRALDRSGKRIYRVARGDARIGMGDLEGALRDYDLPQKGKDVNLMLRYGNTLLRMKEFERAIPVFQACLKKKNRACRNEALLGMADALYGQGLYAEAGKYYEQVVSNKPLTLFAQNGMANIALSERKYHRARSIFNALIRKDSTFLYAYLGRAIANYGLGDFAGAIRDFEKSDALIIASEKTMADVLVCRGYSHYYLSNTVAAIKDFEQAVKLDPARYEALAGLGKIKIDERKFSDAGTYLSAALGYEKQHDGLWSNYGNLLMHFSMFDKAFSVFNTAIGINPSNLNAQNGRGVTMLEKDMLEESRVLFDSLLRTNPGRSFLFNNRGIVKVYEGNRFSLKEEQPAADESYKLAGEDFNRAMENAPSRVFYNVNKGNVLRYWQQYEEARLSYQSYQDKSALNNTAVLLAGLDQLKDARYYMGVALQIDSAHRVFQYNMNLLARKTAKERMKSVASARNNGPGSEISLKYSLDGYVTIYLYDYEYQDFRFPGRHHLPPALKEFPVGHLVPEYDFVFLRYAENKKNTAKKKVGRNPKVRLKARPRSVTRCPVLL